MRKGTCTSCGTELALAQLRAMDGQIYCDPCVTKVAESGQHGEIRQISDPTVCVQCTTDWGNSELAKVGGLPYCPTCREKLYNFAFPRWLKAGLAFSLLLLVVGLVHGARYFQLGRELYRGERQVKAKQYAAAIQSLTPLVEGAPNCQKCVLLLAKAHLLGGHPDLAWSAAKKHKDGHFDVNDEEKEVEALFNRFTTSADKLEAAAKLYEEHKEDESLKNLEAAAHEYPEWDVPRQQIQAFQVTIAFDHKDYDKFVSLAQDAYRADPKSASAAAQVASALACKYAVTGDQQFQDNSRKYLAEARGLAISQEEQAEFQEYSERIEHRLSSREIITREEYNRRYRPNTKQTEPAK